ncbi:MAG: hypothetical protein LBJ71_00610, partial [Holosporaceae bacterium]|nr:hypothetical protein [Holosporaceae bacterium]
MNKVLLGMFFVLNFVQCESMTPVSSNINCSYPTGCNGNLPRIASDGIKTEESDDGTTHFVKTIINPEKEEQPDYSPKIRDLLKIRSSFETKKPLKPKNLLKIENSLKCKNLLKIDFSFKNENLLKNKD